MCANWTGYSQYSDLTEIHSFHIEKETPSEYSQSSLQKGNRMIQI